MASAALPPGFPALEIDGEYYWDGGVHSNSPLEVILEANPEENTLCFLIDCFGGPAYLINNPTSLLRKIRKEFL
jgi:NTE family protein